MLVGMLSWFDRNMWPPALLLAFASDKYDAPLWIASTMLLAWYVSIALSCDAMYLRNFFHSVIVFLLGLLVETPACLVLVVGHRRPLMPDIQTLHILLE